MTQPIRNTSVDLIRTAALVGICVVNLPFLALSPADAIGTPIGRGDRFAEFLVELLFQGKFFLLFSFIFGWGIQIQVGSAARAGVSFGYRYIRRLIGLALLGCLHAVLVFPGDILLLYALLGTLAWPVRNYTPRALVTLAAATIAIEMIALVSLAILLAASPAPPSSFSPGENFIGATLARLSEWPETFSFLVLFQGPLAFGAILLGLAASKSGFFGHQSEGQQQLARRIPMLLLIALPANLLFALAPKGNDMMELAGLLAFAIGAPPLSAVYLHLILRFHTLIRLPDILIEAGKNSLTAYVLQGVIAGLIFGGYGFGFFGMFGKATLLPLAVGVAFLSMIITGFMARFWGCAPLEYILRSITYGHVPTRRHNH